LGSTSTNLMSVNGGTNFSGQLTFNLPPLTQGDSIQISTSIYDGQYGNLITTTGETVQIGAGIQEGTTTTTTVTQNQYPYQYPSQYAYQYPNQSSYPAPYASPYQTSPSQYQSHRAYRTENRATFLDYVVIIVILAAVIIATAGLVLVTRRQPYRQPYWPQIQPPPPR
jgi:hypothetical protein